MIRIFLVFFVMPLLAEAKLVTFGANEVSLAIRYNLAEGSKESVPTYLRFPRAIARIDNATMFSIKATSSSGMQPDYREIEVRPRVTEGSQKVEVLLNDGTVVRLRLKITTDSDGATSYDFEPKRVHEESKSPSPQVQGQIADLSLMRSVIQGDSPVGFSKRFYGMPISCSGGGPRARLLRVLENGQFKIFQLEIVNDSFKRSFTIKEENVVFKNRDLSRSPLIHVTNNLLGPSGKGQNKSVMTILADPTANINRMKVCDLKEQIEAVEVKPKTQR
ncbi:MAG: hypothetical protein HUU57_13140 [Bdellovibrio sp.]|nr:hypothetical protein [Bdellovibrio sp.]